MKSLILILALFMFGCGTMSVETKRVKRDRPKITLFSADQEFDPYLSIFQLEAALYGIPVNYHHKFKVYLARNLAKVKGYVGLCRNRSGKVSIWIDKKEWESSSHLDREALMFHELGHCILSLEHNDTTERNGDPMSIMHSRAYSSSLYVKYRRSYLRELFESYPMKQQQLLQQLTPRVK